MTIYFRNFSTWTGRSASTSRTSTSDPRPGAAGVGRALMAAAGRRGPDRGYARIDWSVLDWNESAIRFYRSIGAVPMAGWTGYRLDGEALGALADEADEATDSPAPDRRRPPDGPPAGASDGEGQVGDQLLAQGPVAGEGHTVGRRRAGVVRVPR